MSGDASDSSDDSDATTNETACTVKHQITNGKSSVVFVVKHVIYGLTRGIKTLLH